MAKNKFNKAIRDINKKKAVANPQPEQEPLTHEDLGYETPTEIQSPDFQTTNDAQTIDLSQTSATIKPPVHTPEAIPPQGDIVSDEEKAVLQQLNIGGTEKAPIQAEQNPLAGNVTARGEHAEIKTDPTLVEPIRSFTPPNQDIIIQEEIRKAKTSENKLPPFNPEIANLPLKEQQEASERFADMILDGWGMVKELSFKLAECKEKTLLQLHNEGKINMYEQTPLGNGQFAPLIEIIRSLNEQGKEAFIFTEKKRQEIRVPLLAILIKHKIGLTPEQELIYLALKEVASTGMAVIGVRSTWKDLLENCQAHWASVKGQGATAPPASTTPPPTATNTATKAEPPKPEGKGDVTDAVILSEPEERANNG